MNTIRPNLRVAAGQFAPGESKANNLAAITLLVENAAANKVRVLVLPELSMYRSIDVSNQEAAAQAESLDGPFVSAVTELSSKHSMLIAFGIYETDPEASSSKENVYNTLVVADGGVLVHAYRKVHLYDAFASRESDTISPGTEMPPVLQVEGYNVGFAICYDIRFPELFRSMADREVEVIAIATAWARGVGKEDHWEILTRCRAIENTAYVIASDEVSTKSVGRSRVIDPLGYVLGDAGERNHALVIAEVEAARLSEVRTVLPALENRRITGTYNVVAE